MQLGTLDLGKSLMKSIDITCHASLDIGKGPINLGIFPCLVWPVGMLSMTEQRSELRLSYPSKQTIALVFYK
jgi:hypothetical protein